MLKFFLFFSTFIAAVAAQLNAMEHTALMEIYGATSVFISNCAQFFFLSLINT